MTTTYSTDNDLILREPLASQALVRVNAMRTDASVAVTTLDAYRVEALRLIQQVLLSRGISADAVTRPAQLVEPEAQLSLAMLFTAAAVKVSGQIAASNLVDVFAEKAAACRTRYSESIASASPVDGVRSVGSSFEWGRG